MSLAAWSWIFLVAYIGLMLLFGVIGKRRVKSADDFATARSSYGPVFLAFAFAATTASGATFLGLPGIAYKAGLPAIWASVMYPAGIYFGVWLCIRMVDRAGVRFGSRSIPEYLGQRYQSETMRILVALFSLLLFFYLAAQLIAGTVMFEIMLGVPPLWALIVTAGVLVVYVSLGGAHADILTDGVQGGLMVALGLLVVALFFSGAGVAGGFGDMLASLEAQDPDLVGWLHPRDPLFHSWWSVIAYFIGLAPLGMLPHIGNKIWALDRRHSKGRFVAIAAVFGLTLAMIGVGGILARAVLGDQLLAEGSSANSALPELFLHLFPGWLAALFGMGILAAVMSTADGLVVSCAQILANDLYRCTFVPRWRKDVDPSVTDRRVLKLSRAATVGVLIACTALGWSLRDRNITLVVTMGSGGLMAAFAGPLLLGAIWRRVTAAGAIAGLCGGMAVFVVLHLGWLDPYWFEGTPVHGAALWLQGERPNPFSCSAIGEIVSVALTWSVSKLTQPLPKAHLAEVFGG